jgi:diacylglycerol kinase family enzyme
MPLVASRFPGMVVRTTTGPGDAETIGREWARAHPEAPVLVVGGDGTVHEAVNGLVLAGWRGRLGVIPLGTGNDFARSAGFPLRSRSPTAGQAEGVPRRVDLGRIRFEAPDGSSREHLFLNAVSVGVSPRANQLAGTIKAFFPGRFCYAIGGVLALLQKGRSRLRIAHDGTVMLDGYALNVTIANGATFGGGMRISPGSRVDDGILDQVIIGPIGAVRALTALSRLYAGTHVAMRGVTVTPVRGVARIAHPDGPLLLEADGHEFLAQSDVSVEGLPGVLALLS